MKSRRALHLAAIWTISLWPALNFLGANWDKIVQRGLRGLSGVLMITLVLGAIGHLLERRAEKRGHDGAVCLPWLATICLLFSYGPVSNFGLLTFEELALRTTPALVWWGLVVVAVLVSILLRQNRVAIAMSTAFSIAVAVMALTRLLFVLSHVHHEVRAPMATLAPVANKPPRLPGLNVYYILLDAYAGQLGLKLGTGFDNADFYARMATRGFQDVSTEKSNYMRTTFTLGGIFLLDYPRTVDPETAKNNNNVYPELFDAPNAPPLISRLNAAGYTTFHSATTWGGCAHRYLVCLGESFVLDTDYLTKSFLADTPFSQEIVILGEESDDAIRSISTRLPLLMEKSQPFFIFAHDLASHPPFRREAGCKRSYKPGEGSMSWDDDRRATYAGAIQCLNGRILELVDVIVAVDPNALIVLQADHGSAFGMKWDKPMSTWSIDSIHERRSYLNLVRAPADCRQWLDHPLGQVNTARFVVACVEGRTPQYLPERGYMSTYMEGPESGVVRLQPDF